jgi:hypothetical protein
MNYAGILLDCGHGTSGLLVGGGREACSGEPDSRLFCRVHIHQVLVGLSSGCLCNERDFPASARHAARLMPHLPLFSLLAPTMMPPPPAPTTSSFSLTLAHSLKSFTAFRTFGYSYYPGFHFGCMAFQAFNWRLLVANNREKLSALIFISSCKYLVKTMYAACGHNVSELLVKTIITSTRQITMGIFYLRLIELPT